MKNIVGILFALCIAGCCSDLPKDISLQPLPDKQPPADVHTIPVTGSTVEGHFVDCRSRYSGAEKELVDQILGKVKDSNSAVVLYFHGGLSGQSYMKETLGPQLMCSVFNQSQVKGKLYPIFMNYDAQPDLGSLPLTAIEVAEKDAGQEIFSLMLAQGATDILRGNGILDMEAAVSLLMGVSKNTPDESLQTQASMAINRLSGKQPINSLTLPNREPTAAEVKYLLNLLDAKELPAEFINGFDNVNLQDAELKMQQDLFKFSANLTEVEKSRVTTHTLSSLGNQYKLRILRILVRFALKSDHGMPATVQEEYLDLIFKLGGNIQSIAGGHWDKVKTNAKQCFGADSNGRALINGLIERGIKIYTLSHSAGSIPTAEMVQYLSADHKSPVIEKAVMVVPAINQTAFNKLVIPNQQVFKSLDVYALTESAERNDSVGVSALYSASLLYGVSAMGENSKFMDKMLLIDQHMQADRAPYKFGRYLCAVCESPKNTWEFFFKGNSNANFILYPLNRGAEIQKGAATHGGTKFPWVSPDLARSILKSFGIQDTDSMHFDKPESKTSCAGNE